MKTFFTSIQSRFGLITNNSVVKISEREKEIINLLSQGLASKQIAQELHISKHTVDTHRRNLLRKTASKNSLELITNYKETIPI
jgi:DNA-binding CsgD family transcriptional regulator